MRLKITVTEAQHSRLRTPGRWQIHGYTAGVRFYDAMHGVPNTVVHTDAHTDGLQTSWKTAQRQHRDRNIGPGAVNVLTWSRLHKSQVSLSC